MEVNDPCEVLLVVVMLCCADAYSELAWVLGLGWMYCIGGSQWGFLPNLNFLGLFLIESLESKGKSYSIGSSY